MRSKASDHVNVGIADGTLEIAVDRLSAAMKADDKIGSKNGQKIKSIQGQEFSEFMKQFDVDHGEVINLVQLTEDIQFDENDTEHSIAFEIVLITFQLNFTKEF